MCLSCISVVAFELVSLKFWRTGRIDIGLKEDGKFLGLDFPL